MAVFTSISDAEAQSLLNQYDLGAFKSLTGIAAGIENTNYFLETTQGSFVLTIFEVLKAHELPFYIELMHHLATNGSPVPQPQTQRSGLRLAQIHDKPAAIVSKLSGAWVPDPTVQHCKLAAHTLAHCHLAGLSTPIKQANLRDSAWRHATAPEVIPFLDNAQKALIHKALEEDRNICQSDIWRKLPSGPAHCDLFRDNVLFESSGSSLKMGGFIDFYFAGVEAWLFDVAVAVNDWCIDRNTGALKPELVNAWVDAYAAVRPFTIAEKNLWTATLRIAALRFWVSRLYDFHMPRAAETLKPHDPTHFERILSCRFEFEPPLLS
jgi:homoserine kinase type II